MRMAQLPEWQNDVMDESSWSNASKLSRKVRELAQQSYRALQVRGPLEERAGLCTNDNAEELRALRDQVLRLQGKIRARRLERLMPWIDALRCRIEARLGLLEKQEAGR
jgi:hypothetical protein